MLLNKEKDFLKEFNIKNENDSLLEEIKAYEAKYQKNSLDVLQNEEKYFRDQDMQKWIQKIKVYLEANGSMEKINTIIPIMKTAIIGSDVSILKKIDMEKPQMILITSDNPLLKTILSYSLMSMTFIYVLSRKPLHFHGNKMAQNLIVDNPDGSLLELSDNFIK